MSEADATAQVPAIHTPKPPIVAGGTVAAIIPATFDEAARIGNAFSKSGLAPRTLQSPEACTTAIIAGAELGLPPFMSLQSFAVVNGRATLWGDAIPALLWSRGFKLREWFENLSNDYPDNMTAFCEVTRPTGEVIVGEFSVFDAKEALLFGIKDGPWKTAKKRMLKMRARAFAARDGAPDVLRGLPIYEEAVDFDALPDAPTGRKPKTDIKGKLAAPKSDSAGAANGIDPAHLASELGDAKPADENDQEAEFEPVTEGGKEPDPPAAAQTAEAGSDTKASATPASTGSAAASSSQSTLSEASTDGEDEAEGDIIEAGHANPGETYHLAGDIWDEDGRRHTYQDGKPFSRQTSEAELAIYAEHPPEVPADESKPGKASGAEEGSKTEDLGPPETGFLAEAATKDSWLVIKPLWVPMTKTDDWAEATPEDQDDVRRALRKIVEGVKVKFGDPVDQADDPTYFGIWCAGETGKDGADAIEGTLAVLKRSAAFLRLKPEQQAAVETKAMARVKAMRGG